MHTRTHMCMAHTRACVCVGIHRCMHVKNKKWFSLSLPAHSLLLSFKCYIRCHVIKHTSFVHIVGVFFSVNFLLSTQPTYPFTCHLLICWCGLSSDLHNSIMLIFKMVKSSIVTFVILVPFIVLQTLLPVLLNGAIDGETSIPVHLKSFQQCFINTAHILYPFLLHNGFFFVMHFRLIFYGFSIKLKL